MNMQNNMLSKEQPYTLKNFLPLIALIIIIITFTVLRQLLYGFNLHIAMNDFMGSFFIVFSAFKIINLRGFAEAYRVYDIIAKRIYYYGYIYPFIEFFLGIAYLMRYKLFLANWITLVIMIVNSIGVIYELAQQKQIVCACLGVVFKIPMTYVTLVEDLIMAVMAFVMLFLF
jgi:hypothetical protein